LLLNYIFKIAKNENIDKIILDSSITAKSFFEEFGFKQIKENLVKKIMWSW
jgi:N-acetylglutamate synthase-like GNAT family acetyltransferase